MHFTFDKHNVFHFIRDEAAATSLYIKLEKEQTRRVKLAMYLLLAQ